MKNVRKTGELKPTVFSRTASRVVAAWIAMWIFVGFHATLSAQTPTVSVERLKLQKEVRQQASDDARDLVRDVLDVQLQQFRDNNLTSHPWYGEIRSMRDHLDEMVNTRMKEVVDILEKAEGSSNAGQRALAFQTARAKSREILVRIQVEEQILLRRLKIAELARQIQQLIEHQTKVRKETEAVPGEPTDRRNELNLAALEDQRDVAASFGQFKQSLRQTVHFGGDVGREAAEAVQMVDKQQIDHMMIKAETGLRRGDFTIAVGSQRDIIAALEALLQKIRHMQKAMDATSLEEKIAEALNKQEELREASAKKPLEPDVADKLAAQQDEMAKKIDELSASAKASVRAALEQAKQEAAEAANNLLEQKQSEALAHQDKAVLDLKAAAHEAQKSRPAGDTNQPETADDAKRQELENKIERLAAAADKLEKAAETERQIANDANQAKEKEGLKSDQAADLGKKNEEATADAKSADDDAASSVPKADEEIKKALDSMNDAAKDLNKAQQSKSADTTKSDAAEKSSNQAKTQDPREADGAPAEKASREAKSTAQEAGKHADEAAQDLTKAAEEVRKEAQKIADELAKHSQEQSEKLASLKQKVDNELAKAMDPTTDRLSALAQAKKKVEEALQHQAEADQAAEKAQTAKKIADKPKGDHPGGGNGDEDKPTGDKQAGDQDSGEKPADADKNDPQSRVSEASKQAAELAEAGAPKAAETLNKATAQSDQARQETSKGSPQQASADRKATKESLEEAKKELDDAIHQLSAAASKHMGEEAKESGELADEAKPLDAEAAHDLGDAQHEAQQAGGNPSETPADMQAAQSGVRQDLAMASAELAARQQQIAAEMAQAQSQAQGNHEAGGHDPERDQMSVAGHRSSQGAKRAGPDGPSSPDRKGPNGQDLRNEPWVANLPPEARDTMRSNAQRRPPPGYERRTKEYFENLDK